MEISEQEIQEARRVYMNMHFNVNNLEAEKANKAFLSGARMVAIKNSKEITCDRDCPDADCGNCCHPNSCCKIYKF